MILNFVWKSKNLKLCTFRKLSTVLNSEPVENTSLSSDLRRQWQTSKDFKSVPGPTKFQMFRAFQRGGDFHGIPFGTVAEICRERYGDIYLLPGLFGQEPNLFCYNLNDHEKIYRTEGQYPVRPGTGIILHQRLQRKDGFFDDNNVGILCNGPQWAKYRHAVNPVLMQKKNTLLYIDPVQKVNEDCIQRILNIRNPTTLEVPKNFVTELQHLAFESVAAVALDAYMGVVLENTNATEPYELFNNLNFFNKSFFDLGFRPSFYRYIETPSYKRFDKAANKVVDICRKFVGEAQQRAIEKAAVAPETESILEKLVKIDRKIAEIIAIDMLIGSIETTTSALSGLLLCIATNPEKQEILREEVLTNIGKSEKFTMENMQQLPYLRACIKEAMRLYPTFLANMRSTGMDLSLSGYQIPKGTNVFLASNLIRKQNHFFPRHKEFLPERWLRASIGDEISAKNISPFIHMPFGFGPRSCVAKRIVEMQLEITLANIVRHFRLEYNYPTKNAFSNNFIRTCVIPLNFKFDNLHKDN